MPQGGDDYPDLGYGTGHYNDTDERPEYDDEFESDNFRQSIPSGKVSKKKTIRFRQSNDNESSLMQQNAFDAFPAIVHFSGWVAGREFVQVVSIKNASKKSIRFQIYPPTSPEFSIQYEKQGSLAPGMVQKIAVRFSASEYKYYYDCFSIQGEGDAAVLVPLHAYPIINKVYFPKHLEFGKIPLCEPTFRVSELLDRCCMRSFHTFLNCLLLI